MRRIGLILTLGLIGALIPSSLVVAQPLDACALNEIGIENFHIKLAKLKPAYRIGDTVPFRLTITRPAHKDPVTAQPMKPPRSEPAEDVNVSVGMIVESEDGDYYHYGGGTTGQDGKVLIRIKIEDYVEPGVAHLRVYAEKELFRDPARCLRIYEYGYKAKPSAFRVEE